MSSLYSAPSQRSASEQRGSGIPYDRVSSDECEPFDSNAIGEALATSRSSSTVMLVRRVRTVGSWTVPFLMIGTYIAAIAFIVAHHVFLIVLDGKLVQDFTIPQTWVRDVGNALARVIQILLETSVGVALTQSIWIYLRRSTVTISELDDIFALPSLASISFTALRLRPLYVLLIAVNIQAFSLVGIFAPNALSVVPASPISSVLSVPSPALDKISITDSSMTLAADAHGDWRTYISPSTGFKTLVQYVLSKGDILPWNTPAGCGLACNYSIVYHAPSLRCRDIPPSSIAFVFDGIYEGTAAHLGFEPTHMTSVPEATLNLLSVYNATSTLGYVSTSMYVTTPGNDLYDLSLVYSTGTTHWNYIGAQNISTADTGGGSYCIFVNATYSASVRFSNGTQSIDAHILDYGEPYQSLMNDTKIIDSRDLSGLATLGLMDAMTRYLVGSAALIDAAISNNTRIFGGAALFTIQVDNTTITFHPTGGRNISRTLEDLFTNVTASLMSDTANLGIRTEVSATVLPNKTIYEYQPSRLWLVYGIALGVALIADLFGLACMRSNGVAMQCNFSSIAASMRAPELDDLLNRPEEPPRADAKVVKLRYRVGGGELEEKSGFRIVQDADGVQMGSRRKL